MNPKRTAGRPKSIAEPNVAWVAQLPKKEAQRLSEYCLRHGISHGGLLQWLTHGLKLEKTMPISNKDTKID